MQYDAIVIGAGHNGLVAAAYLARAGQSVVVFERREIVGGAAVSERLWPGWSVSTASYVCSLLHPNIVRDLDLASFGYIAYAKEPASFTPLLDRRSLLLSSDAHANDREIGAFSHKDEAGFCAFEAEAKRLGSQIFESLLDDAPDFEKFDSRTRAQLRGSAADLVERYVRTPVLQATLVTDGVVGTDAGPRDRGTGYVLAHHYAGRALGVQGLWGYVRGGMGSVSNALAQAATAAGARIVTGSAVARIRVCDERAAGVTLQNGSECWARAVLSNADPKTTFLGLAPLGALEPTLIERVRAWRCNGVSMKVNLALAALPNFSARPGSVGQAHHRATIHIAPTIDYIQRAHRDSAAVGASREPMLECFLQTPTDPTLAPPNKHLLSIFTQYFPYDHSVAVWTQDRKDQAADLVVRTLARYAPNLPAVIEARQTLAPPDLEERFGMAGGHIFHGELLPGQVFEHRFATRTPLAGLYLCGSGAHPGGCVSGAPGLRAAKMVIADLALAGPRRNFRAPSG